MADGVVGLQPDSTGKKVDTSELIVGTNTVERQRINIADASNPLGLTAVVNAAPVGTEFALVTRNVPSGVQAVLNSIGPASWGQSLAVVAGATATPVNIVSTPAGYQIKGILCHGTADGYFAIQVGGVTVVSGRTRSTAPMLQLILPNGISTVTGSNIAVRVTNESGSTADYEVTLLGA